MMHFGRRSNHNRSDSPAATLQTAINKFNAGDYFVSHEFLEALWLNRDDPHRELYQGILQIGIGLLHLQRGNVSGARQLLHSGSRLLEPFTPARFGIDLSALQSDANCVLDRLADPNRTHTFQVEDAIQIQMV